MSEQFIDVIRPYRVFDMAVKVLPITLYVAHRLAGALTVFFYF